MLRKFLFTSAISIGIIFTSATGFAKGEEYGSYLVSSYALDKGDVRSASKYYMAYVQDHPNDIDNMRKGYMVMAMAGDMETAAFYANQDTEKNKPQVADLIIAMEKARTKDYKSAIKYLDIFASPNESIKILCSFPMAWLYAGEKDYEKALKALEIAKNEPELKAIFHLHSGMINELAGNEEKAISHYEQVMKNGQRLSPKGIQIAAQTLNKAGKTNLVEEFFLNLENNSISTFLSDYKDYLLAPKIYNDPITVNIGLAEAYFNMSSLFIQAGSSELAEMLYANALLLYPEFYSLRLMYAELYEQANEFDRANEMYSVFTVDTPFGFSALTKKALALKKSSDDIKSAYERANKALEYLANTFPDNITLTINYADFLKANEEYGKSAVLYSKVLNKVTDKDGNIPDKYWVVVFARAAALERAGLWKSAEKDLYRTVEMSNENPVVLNYLGYSLLSRGEKQTEAFEMIKKASKKKPYDGHITDSLGWAYYLMGEYENAEEVLERALDLLPDNSVVLDHLGDVYWKVGRKLEAEFQWKKALQMNKDLEKDDPQKIKYKIENGLDDFEKNYKQG